MRRIENPDGWVKIYRDGSDVSGLYDWVEILDNGWVRIADDISESGEVHAIYVREERVDRIVATEPPRPGEPNRRGDSTDE